MRKLVVAGAAAVLLAASVTIGAETQTAAGAAGARFEVASIRRNTAGGRTAYATPPGGRVSATNVPLRLLIRQAYQLQDFQIVDAPAWIDTDRFDIEARAAGDVPGSQLGAVGPLQLMLQALLADRFQLKTRMEQRELSTFLLVPVQADRRLGPQLRVAGPGCAPVTLPGGLAAPPPPPAGPTLAGAPVTCPSLAGPFFITGRRMTMEQLAQGLSARVARPVVDRTGLDGSFDFELSFTPDEVPAGQPVRFNGQAIEAGPSIYTAIQEQLGLKLEATRAPVAVLVIESVQQPSEN